MISRKTSLTGFAPQVLLILAISWLIPVPGQAEQPASLCGSLPYQPDESLLKQAGQQVDVQANNVQLTANNSSLFSGNVEITSRSQQLKADQVEYLQEKDFLRAEGNVQIFTPKLKMTGKRAELNIADNHGSITDATFQTTRRGRGSAGKIEFKAEAAASLSQASFTTCDPDKVDWQMTASEIEIDNENRQGHAWNVVLEFKGVPFFYFPYLRFPVGEDRLSGFLFPDLGSSDQHGNEVSLPFYWNIAPDMEATLTPWYMSKRGTMLKNEFRYLNQHSSGQIEFDYLQDDKLFNDDRERIHWTHRGDSNSGWSSYVNYNKVGDNQHLVDFTTQLENTSTTHLNQNAGLDYNAESWFFKSSVQRYQTLSGTTPYQQLPRLNLATRDRALDNQFNFNIESELVRFDHPDEQVIGNRFDMTTSVSYPLRTAATHFIPRLSLRHTQYELEQVTPGEEQNPSRTLPIFSLDTGVVFERNSQWFASAYTQTLEPQLYYLYVPYRDQSSLPVFDTSLTSFNINLPLTENRFIGADRVGDTSQVTAALASRFFRDQDGKEVFLSRIGQVFYFRDREVTLPGGTVETDEKSNIIAQLISRPGSYWYLGTDLEWDYQLEQLAAGNARIGYDDNEDLKIQAVYRYQRDELRTAELGFRWRMTPRWQLTARRLHDVLLDRTQEDQLAVRYDSCCWGLTVQWSERFQPGEAEPEQAVYLQLELKGLSSLGSRPAISGLE